MTAEQGSIEPVAATDQEPQWFLRTPGTKSTLPGKVAEIKPSPAAESAQGQKQLCPELPPLSTLPEQLADKDQATPAPADKADAPAPADMPMAPADKAQAAGSTDDKAEATATEGPVASAEGDAPPVQAAPAQRQRLRTPEPALNGTRRSARLRAKTPEKEPVPGQSRGSKLEEIPEEGGTEQTPSAARPTDYNLRTRSAAKAPSQVAQPSMLGGALGKSAKPPRRASARKEAKPSATEQDNVAKDLFKDEQPADSAEEGAVDVVKGNAEVSESSQQTTGTGTIRQTTKTTRISFGKQGVVQKEETEEKVLEAPLTSCSMLDVTVEMHKESPAKQNKAESVPESPKASQTATSTAPGKSPIQDLDEADGAVPGKGLPEETRDSVEESKQEALATEPVLQLSEKPEIGSQGLGKEVIEQPKAEDAPPGNKTEGSEGSAQEVVAPGEGVAGDKKPDTEAAAEEKREVPAEETAQEELVGTKVETPLAVPEETPPPVETASQDPRETTAAVDPASLDPSSAPSPLKEKAPPIEEEDSKDEVFGKEFETAVAATISQVFLSLDRHPPEQIKLGGLEKQDVDDTLSGQGLNTIDDVAAQGTQPVGSQQEEGAAGEPEGRVIEGGLDEDQKVVSELKEEVEKKTKMLCRAVRAFARQGLVRRAIMRRQLRLLDKEKDHQLQQGMDELEEKYDAKLIEMDVTIKELKVTSKKRKAEIERLESQVKRLKEEKLTRTQDHKAEIQRLEKEREAEQKARAEEIRNAVEKAKAEGRKKAVDQKVEQGAEESEEPRAFPTEVVRVKASELLHGTAKRSTGGAQRSTEERRGKRKAQTTPPEDQDVSQMAVVQYGAGLPRRSERLRLMGDDHNDVEDADLVYVPPHYGYRIRKLAWQKYGRHWRCFSKILVGYPASDGLELY